MQLTLQENVDLFPYNTFGIHAQSRLFTVIKNLSDIKNLVAAEHLIKEPLFILGGGSNILFTQDFDGLIIKNEIMGIKCIKETAENVFLKIGGGENWHDLVLHCIEKGYGGVENLSLIPGTVGAAPIQNIGAYGVELKDVFHELDAIQLSTGELKSFKHADCHFGYRESIFKSKKKNEYFITHVTLRLEKKPSYHVQYAALKEALNRKNIKDLSLRAISDAVINIRQSKLPDPKEIGNAGSFFKNPIIPIQQFMTLQKDYSEIPFFPEPCSDLIKIPAGWLIEQCGWKGKKIGNIGIYDKQALVIVNYGKGTGSAIWAFAQQVQTAVFERFGISLTPEVNIL